jgi:hypothetical protein
VHFGNEISNTVPPRDDHEVFGTLDLRMQNDSIRQMTMPNKQAKKAFLNPDSG